MNMKFNPEYEVTIGTEFMAKNIAIKGRNVRIQIWDTAGEEAYRSITRSYYKSSACVFIVYDISDRKTFDDVDLWLKDCREICFKNVQIYLIGNKSDLKDKRQVTEEEGKNFAEENNLKFYETSALNGTNIEEIFVESATDLMDKLERGEFKDNFENSGIKIYQYPNQEVENIITDKKRIHVVKNILNYIKILFSYF